MTLGHLQNIIFRMEPVFGHMLEIKTEFFPDTGAMCGFLLSRRDYLIHKKFLLEAQGDNLVFIDENVYHAVSDDVYIEFQGDK